MYLKPNWQSMLHPTRIRCCIFIQRKHIKLRVPKSLKTLARDPLSLGVILLTNSSILTLEYQWTTYSLARSIDHSAQVAHINSEFFSRLRTSHAANAILPTGKRGNARSLHLRQMYSPSPITSIVVPRTDRPNRENGRNARRLYAPHLLLLFVIKQRVSKTLTPTALKNSCWPDHGIYIWYDYRLCGEVVGTDKILITIANRRL